MKPISSLPEKPSMTEMTETEKKFRAKAGPRAEELLEEIRKSPEFFVMEGGSDGTLSHSCFWDDFGRYMPEIAQLAAEMQETDEEEDAADAEMETGCFYIFENQAVSIKEVLKKGLVRIQHITRNYNEDGNQIPSKEEDVYFDKLTKMTRKLAKEMIKKYNRRIGECNTRIHAFEECLNYM